MRLVVRSVMAGVLIPAGTLLLLELFLGGILALAAPAWLPGSLRELARHLYLNFIRTVPQLDTAFARYDPELVYTLRPGVSTVFSGREFHTAFHVNSAGLRDDEAALSAPEVIVLGDSFAMGWGVRADQTFAAIIGRQTGLKVLNAGVASYGTVREMRMLGRVDTSRLRYLVIQYCANDLGENLEFEEAHNRYVAEPWERYAEAMASYQAAKRYYVGHYAIEAFRWAREVGQGWIADRTPDTTSPADASEPDEARAFLNAVLHAGSTDLRGVHVIVFEVNPWGSHGSDLIAGLRKRKASPEYPPYIREAALVDLYASLQPRHFFSLDDHLNAAGHLAVAEAVVAAMRGSSPGGFHGR